MTSAGRTRRLPYRAWRQTPIAGRGHDREQRRRRRLDLPEPERDEGRDEQDAAADAEEARQHPGSEAEDERRG